MIWAVILYGGHQKYVKYANWFFSLVHSRRIKQDVFIIILSCKIYKLKNIQFLAWKVFMNQSLKVKKILGKNRKKIKCKGYRVLQNNYKSKITFWNGMIAIGLPVAPGFKTIIFQWKWSATSLLHTAMDIRLQTIADIWSKVGVLWGGVADLKSTATPLTV